MEVNSDDGDPGELACGDCGRTFKRRCNLVQHMNSKRCKSASGNLKCNRCKAHFARADSLRRHLLHVHQVEIEQMFACGVCEAVFSKAEEVEHHRKTAHEQRTDFVAVESAFCRQAQLLRAFIPEETGKNIDQTFVYAFTQICRLIKELKVEFKYMKCGTVLHVEMARYDEQGLLTEVKVFPFRGYSMCISRLTSEHEVKADVARVVGDYERALEEFLHMGSGWTVLRGMFLEVEVSQTLPLAGFAQQRNCTLHIVKYNTKAGCAKAQNFCNRPLEPELAEEMVNCFYLAVAAYYTKNFFWSDNRKMIERARELFHFVPKGVADADGFTIEDISTFERLNKDELPMSICVLYRDEDKDIFPVRLGNGKDEYDQITLLLYYTDEGELHFALIADPGRVLARRSRQTTGKLQTCSVFLCNKCCNVLVSERAYLIFTCSCISSSFSLPPFSPPRRRTMPTRSFASRSLTSRASGCRRTTPRASTAPRGAMIRAASSSRSWALPILRRCKFLLRANAPAMKEFYRRRRRRSWRMKCWRRRCSSWRRTSSGLSSMTSLTRCGSIMWRKRDRLSNESSPPPHRRLRFAAASDR